MADSGLIEGEPDLVVELRSAPNRAFDEQVTSRVYTEAGVRQYWLAP